MLVASSTDGYCTIVAFTDDELGVPLASSDLPIGAKMAATNIDISPPAIPSIASVPSSNQTTPHREIAQEASCAENSSNRKAGPRRVQLITLSTTPQNPAAAVAATTAQQKTSDAGTGNSLPASTTDTIVIL